VGFQRWFRGFIPKKGGAKVPRIYLVLCVSCNETSLFSCADTRVDPVLLKSYSCASGREFVVSSLSGRSEIAVRFHACWGGKCPSPISTCSFLCFDGLVVTIFLTSRLPDGLGGPVFLSVLHEMRGPGWPLLVGSMLRGIKFPVSSSRCPGALVIFCRDGAQKCS